MKGLFHFSELEGSSFFLNVSFYYLLSKLFDKICVYSARNNV